VVGYKYDGDNFIFNVESVSGLEPDEIIAQAVDAIEEKASQFGKLLGKLE
jgi:DNA-directed RNA polymerase alpha subunit